MTTKGSLGCINIMNLLIVRRISTDVLSGAASPKRLTGGKYADPPEPLHWNETNFPLSSERKAREIQLQS